MGRRDNVDLSDSDESSSDSDSDDDDDALPAKRAPAGAPMGVPGGQQMGPGNTNLNNLWRNKANQGQ